MKAQVEDLQKACEIFENNPPKVQSSKLNPAPTVDLTSPSRRTAGVTIKSEPTVHGYPEKRLEEKLKECSMNDDEHKIAQNSISNKKSPSTAQHEKRSADLKNNISFNSVNGEKVSRDETPSTNYSSNRKRKTELNILQNTKVKKIS